MTDAMQIAAEDVTLVAWSAAVALRLEAAERLAADGISAMWSI